MKKLLLASVVFLTAVSFAVVLKTQAGPLQNGSGWLWGGGAESDGVAPWDNTNTNVGWISLNSTNCDAVAPFGQVDNPPPAGCPPAGTAMGDYGVNIPVADGNLSGYGWSENLGWIDFAPAGPYPAAPNYSATRVGNNLRGWARVVAIRDAATVGNSGGWDGWIKLSSESGDPFSYGIILNADGTITGGQNTSFAWSGETPGNGLGWFDFSRASLVAVDQLKICATCTASSSRLGTLFLSQGGTYAAKACQVVSTESTCQGTDVTSSAIWSPSSNPVASVNAAGTITGNSIGGPVTVTASSGGLTDTLDVTVTCAPTNSSCTPENTCSGQTCDNGCEIITGTKSCGSLPGNWIEVAP